MLKLVNRGNSTADYVDAGELSAKEVTEKRFREDLYYRLKAVSI
jgi:hypothetical protein